MEIDRWRRVEELYHAVHARPADEQEAFLDEACAGDVELRREVESLLTQSQTSGGNLGRWCMNRSWPATIPARVGHLPMAYDAAYHAESSD